MTQAVKGKTGKRNVATQTNDIDTMLEIARLQEQVKLLTIEVDHLRKYTNENQLNVLKPITPTTPNDVNETPRHSEQKQRAVHNQSSKAVARGCNCKGKCASKICGCVKKNAQCGEWCKCSSGVCQNQENKDVDQNKENVEVGEPVDKYLEDHPIVNKQLADVKSRKGLFSPDVTIPDPVLNEEQLSTAPLYFGNIKKLTFESDEETGNEVEEKSSRNKSKKHIANEQKAGKKRRGKDKTKYLKENNSRSVRHKSTSSGEKEEGSDRAWTEKQVSKKNNEEFDTIGKQINNYMKNVKLGMVSLRRGKRVKQTTKIKDSNHASSNEETGSSPEAEETRTLNTDVNGLLDLPTSLKEHFPEAKQSSHANKDGDMDFNPMKPKHELPRTPVRSDNETLSSNMSDTFLSTPVISVHKEEEVKETQALPPELTQPEVDWEEYQSQLVACGKCKRKFHPYRIKKHMSCCKKL